ncbi:MAG: hypothetical protein IJY70_05870, partial [Clostridia bacterium]|nr:hypothetical protein [Clostridia bacterium]
IRHASHMSVALRHYWLSFLVFAVLFVVSLIIIHDSIPKANPLSDWLPYLIVIVAPFILAGIYSAIVRKIWDNKCYQLKRSNEMRDWENLQKQIKQKYEPQMDAIYDAKYRDTISDLNKELEKKTEFYENARQVYLQYKFKGTVFVYFESMKHGWTQEWCACGVYIDGNQVYYTQNEQLFFVKLNPGYHSVQIKMSAKLSDGISSYTYSYQLSPEDCPAFLVFNKFDLYGDIRQVGFEEFEKVTKKPLVK